MFDLFKKKELNSKEFETLITRLIDVEHRVRGLELAEDDFRDKVLRKIQRKAEIETPSTSTNGKRRFGSGGR